MNSATHVTLDREKVGNISATEDSSPWSIASFAQHLHVQIHTLSQHSVEFDLVGIDAAIANALRRILIAEIPTVAIEHVYIWINTSLVQDEVLAQRLGLIPILCDPEQVEWRQSSSGPNDANTVVFKLAASCSRLRTSPDDIEPEHLFSKPAIYSGDIVFAPKGDQHSRFSHAPRPVEADILIAKLRPGQEIVCEMHCEKGIGRDHAKWSPVATASYRLLPSIDIIQPIPSSQCAAFANCFPQGVIQLDKDRQGNLTASVKNARLDTVSREVLRHPQFSDKIRLGRKRDHYIFRVEAVGQYAAETLVAGAMKIFKQKLKICRQRAEILRESM